MKKLVSIAGLAALFTICASAQMFTLTSTTLSSQVLKTDTQVCLTSATGVSVPNLSTPGTMLFVDFEPMQVTLAGSSSTCFVVDRHWNVDLTTYSGTPSAAVSHINGSTVYLGPPNQFFVVDKYPGAACTTSNEYVLPFINIQTGHIFQCPSGGQWVQIKSGTLSSAAIESRAAWCGGTAGSAETEYLNGGSGTAHGVCSADTTAYTHFPIASPGILYNFQVFSTAVAVGGASVDVATVYKNGSSTAITCTIAAAAKSCSDTTHSITVNAGDYLTFQFVTATSDTAANIVMTVEKF